MNRSPIMQSHQLNTYIYIYNAFMVKINYPTIYLKRRKKRYINNPMRKIHLLQQQSDVLRYNELVIKRFKKEFKKVGGNIHIYIHTYKQNVLVQKYKCVTCCFLLGRKDWLRLYSNGRQPFLDQRLLLVGGIMRNYHQGSLKFQNKTFVRPLLVLSYL